MHPVARTFHASIVEGRFIPVLTSLGVIGMRVGLYLWGDMPGITLNDGNFLWNRVAFIFDPPPVSLLFSTLSVFIIAWVLSMMNRRFSLIRSRSSLPFVVPLFLLSLHPCFIVMSGNYIAIIFILLAFLPLLESYQRQNSYLFSFRSAILIAIASLFQIYALLLIPLWWRGERSMRGAQPRALLSFTFGVFLVYISLFSVFFVMDDIDGFLKPFSYLISFSLPAVPIFTITEWVGVAMVGMFIVLNIILCISTYNRDKVITLSFMQFLVFMITFLLLLQVVYWSMTLFFFYLTVTLVSYLNAYIYTKATSKNHIYLAFVMLALMALFYLSQVFPSTMLP